MERMSEEPPSGSSRKGDSTPKQGERKADLSTNSDTEQDLYENDNDNVGSFESSFSVLLHSRNAVT